MAIISYNFQRLPSEDQDQISVVCGASLGTFWYRGWSSHDPEGTGRLFLPQLLDGVSTSLQEKYRRFLHISSYIIIYNYIPGIEIPVSLSEGSVPRTSEGGVGALGEHRPRYRGTKN